MTRFERILHEACKMRDSDALRTESVVDGLLDVLGSVLLFDALHTQVGDQSFLYCALIENHSLMLLMNK